MPITSPTTNLDICLGDHYVYDRTMSGTPDLIETLIKQQTNKLQHVADVPLLVFIRVFSLCLSVICMYLTRTDVVHPAYVIRNLEVPTLVNS
jgi:hypothetical protein